MPASINRSASMSGLELSGIMLIKINVIQPHANKIRETDTMSGVSFSGHTLVGRRRVHCKPTAARALRAVLITRKLVHGKHAKRSNQKNQRWAKKPFRRCRLHQTPLFPQPNKSLGHKVSSIAVIPSVRDLLPGASYRQEILCQWEQ